MFPQSLSGEEDRVHADTEMFVPSFTLGSNVALPTVWWRAVLWYSYVQYDAVIDVIGDILGFIINDASMVQTSILI